MEDLLRAHAMMKREVRRILIEGEGDVDRVLTMALEVLRGLGGRAGGLAWERCEEILRKASDPTSITASDLIELSRNLTLLLGGAIEAAIREKIRTARPETG
ncbi:MAG: hypothetical protein DRO06_04110 [Thermoproteota archaeon]|nr:MAG: hypothetical protein DRO06_04110 [Candidatus Korarchaeota archaeon]